MKKHCVLIQAHKDISYFLSLAEENKHVNFYLHIDKKSKYFPNIEEFENFFLIKKRVNVYWGGISQVKATLELFKESYSNLENYYFHLVSGQDVLVSSFDDIEKDWTQNYDNSIMINCVNADNLSYRVRWGVPHANTKYTLSFIGRLITLFVRVMDVIFKNNKIIYMGSSWFSIVREDLGLLMNDLKDEIVYNKFKNKLCPDEHFFQYLVKKNKILNNKYVNKNKRLILFDKKYNSGRNPIYLDLNKLQEIKKTNKYWFARKVEDIVARDFLKITD